MGSLRIAVLSDIHAGAPHVGIPKLHASVQWMELLRGHLVSDFRFDHPSFHLDLRKAQTEAKDPMLKGRNAYEGTEFITSTDERFRPVNLFNGPDGALYVVDMYRGLIQHRTYVTTYLRKQVEERHLERPVGMGRIYRIVPDGAPKPNFKLTLASEDVIHSFFIPAFRIKNDVVPGRFMTEWFQPTRAGEYHLFCAEYCGTDHSRMGGTVYVMDETAYQQWLTRGNVQETLAQSGERLFRELGCSGCHTGNSQIRAPRLEGLFGRPVPLASGKVVRADEGYIRDSILLPQTDVAAGYEPLMPTFAGRLSEEEVMELVAYIKSLGTK